MENMEKMTKNTFEVKINAAGQKYVRKQQDEFTNNHRGVAEEAVTGVMLATGGLDCPVSSYERYLSNLNPGNDRLRQYIKDSFSDEEECWFQNKPLGIHALRKFMSNLSVSCQLSRVYTNHSIRATGATILS
jgi:hypothetical protein